MGGLIKFKVKRSPVAARLLLSSFIRNKNQAHGDYQDCAAIYLDMDRVITTANIRRGKTNGGIGGFN